jgi:hypothetical protein
MICQIFLVYYRDGDEDWYEESQGCDIRTGFKAMCSDFGCKSFNHLNVDLFICTTEIVKYGVEHIWLCIWNILSFVNMLC